MAGVKQFDVDVTVARIAQTFWRQGYAGTSIEDLERATGLRRGSLYNAFGDKAAMFGRALTEYGADQVAALVSALDDGDPRVALERLVDSYRTVFRRDDRPGGCFLVCSLAELGERADTVGDRAREQAQRLQDGLLAAFERWQADGRLQPGAQPAVLAAYLAAVICGAAVLHKGAVCADSIADAIVLAVRALDPVLA